MLLEKFSNFKNVYLVGLQRIFKKKLNINNNTNNHTYFLSPNTWYKIQTAIFNSINYYND